ncbi:3-oxoacyl-[acyl-carrier-protein] reductase [Candidatus Latescibacterota bacterium]
MGCLDGRVALITGAAQGIGKAIAERFASDGSAIAVCDFNREKATKTASELSARATATAYRMNVADTGSVAEAVEMVMRDFGKIDVLVNNAGITRDTLLLRMKREDWDAVLAVNLTGAYTVSQAVVRHMMKARWGRIINMASVVGIRGNAGQANYAASKAGLIGLTKTMAREFAGRNITVNAIAPGFITTEMTAVLPEEAKQAFLNNIPLNRPGTPDDVAGAALFLAGDDASYLTGQVLCVDGGMIM